MKKLMAIAVLALCASGCVMTRNDTIASVLTLNVKSPDTNFIDNNVKPAKMGVAKATGLICFCEGDASIKAAMEKFTQKSYEIFGKVYQQAGPQGGEQGGPEAGPQGGVHDDGTVESNFTDN